MPKVYPPVAHGVKMTNRMRPHAGATPRASAMTKTALSLTLLASALACLLPAVSAQAQNNRSFISGTGSDANACTFASPCRNAQRAHDMTNYGGEINVLDPAGYGSLTITKAISIQGHGWGELVGAGGATAITINAGATDSINLRGLVIEGFGTGQTAIVFNTGRSLNIQDCVIRHFSLFGINFQPSVASQLNVSNTIVSDMSTAGNASINIAPSGSVSVSAALNRVELDRGVDGIVVLSSGGSVNVTIADSFITHFSANRGIRVQSSSGTAHVMVRNCTITNNAAGIESIGAGALVRVTRSTLTENSTGVFGVWISYGDNNIDGISTVPTPGVYL
jgi:hypothetical protein